MARNFLDDTKANADTDVYEAVLKTINLPKSLKPAYVLLISDGQPTAGVTNPQQIINQIVGLNQGHVPIFGFGSGAFLDKYLMSFLSFTNRGWAQFELNDIAPGIVDAYKQIKDPVLLNLRYYVSGLDKQDIYPKQLPDLFKGSQFVLYGRYTKEQLFYFQLFGDAKNGIKQYLISDDISQAPRDDKRIAKEWAIRKVYQLIGSLEYNKDNQALITEIKKLQQKFHLDLSSFDLDQVNRKK
jgi:Ca-activated chloride channel family protein